MEVKKRSSELDPKIAATAKFDAISWEKEIYFKAREIDCKVSQRRPGQ